MVFTTHSIHIVVSAQAFSRKCTSIYNIFVPSFFHCWFSLYPITAFGTQRHMQSALLFVKPISGLTYPYSLQSLLPIFEVTKTAWHYSSLQSDWKGHEVFNTIKGGSRRAEKSRKVLMMMMKAAKLGWAGTAGHEQGRSKARAGLKHEQGRSRAGTGQVQSWAE